MLMWMWKSFTKPSNHSREIFRTIQLHWKNQYGLLPTREYPVNPLFFILFSLFLLFKSLYVSKSLCEQLGKHKVRARASFNVNRVYDVVPCGYVMSSSMFLRWQHQTIYVRTLSLSLSLSLILTLEYENLINILAEYNIPSATILSFVRLFFSTAANLFFTNLSFSCVFNFHVDFSSDPGYSYNEVHRFTDNAYREWTTKTFFQRISTHVLNEPHSLKENNKQRLFHVAMIF